MQTKQFIPMLALALMLGFGGAAHAQTTDTSGTGTTGTTDTTTSTTGTTAADTTTASTPGTPNTGAGGAAPYTIALLAGSAAIALGSAAYLRRRSA